MEVLVQDLKALPNITSQCEAKVLHMRHTSSQEYLGIYSKCTFLFFIENGAQLKGGLLVQDSKALPNLPSHCKAKVLQMRHTPLQLFGIILSNCIFLAILEKYT